MKINIILIIKHFQYNLKTLQTFERGDIYRTLRIKLFHVHRDQECGLFMLETKSLGQLKYVYGTIIFARGT